MGRYIHVRVWAMTRSGCDLPLGTLNVYITQECPDEVVRLRTDDSAAIPEFVLAGRVLLDLPLPNVSWTTSTVRLRERDLPYEARQCP